MTNTVGRRNEGRSTCTAILCVLLLGSSGCNELLGIEPGQPGVARSTSTKNNAPTGGSASSSAFHGSGGHTRTTSVVGTQPSDGGAGGANPKSVDVATSITTPSSPETAGGSNYPTSTWSIGGTSNTGGRNTAGGTTTKEGTAALAGGTSITSETSSGGTSSASSQLVVGGFSATGGTRLTGGQDNNGGTSCVGGTSQAGRQSSFGGTSSNGGTDSTGGQSNPGRTSSRVGTHCVGCAERQLRIFPSNSTPQFGKRDGGRPYFDMCPDGQSLVGLSYRTEMNYFVDLPQFVGVGAICAPLAAESLDVTVGSDLRLPTRGVSGSQGSIHCASNEVVTGFRGAPLEQPYSPSAIEFHCSSLSLSSLDRDAFVTVTPGRTTALAGQLATAALIEQHECPRGTIAQGLWIRSGAYIDALGLICGTAIPIYPAGATCAYDYDCLSINCQDGTCGPPTCLAPDGCICAVYLSTQYLLCPNRKNKADAAAACAANAMRLPALNSPYETGWLATAMEMRLSSVFWLGGYGTAESTWYWDWESPGAAVEPPPDADDPYNFWDSATSGDTSNGRTCLVLDSGHLHSSRCDILLPFTCELPR